MSKNVIKAKVVKKKKAFPWQKIWYYIKSLFNNLICFDLAVASKWFVALIIFVCSTMISIIPPIVQTSQVQGSQFVQSNQASDPFYFGMYDYVLNSKDEDQIKFNSQKGELAVDYVPETYKDYNLELDASQQVIKPIYSYEKDGKNVLDIYATTADVKSALNNIVYSNSNFGDLDPETTEGQALRDKLTVDHQKYARTTSFLLFGKNEFYARSYNGTQVLGGINGNYNYVNEVFGFKETYTLKELLMKDVKASDTDLVRKETVDKNFKAFLNQIYVDPRTEGTWTTFGIYAGLNGGIILVMGLIIFFMTRGKQNPNRKLKWWECFDIGFWMALCPALLCLAFGFIFPQFASMMFLIFYSFRIMFLTMKYLRPAIQ